MMTHAPSRATVPQNQYRHRVSDQLKLMQAVAALGPLRYHIQHGGKELSAFGVALFRQQRSGVKRRGMQPRGAAGLKPQPFLRHAPVEFTDEQTRVPNAGCP